MNETDNNGPFLIPVTETTSEDLERQALDEYQSSNESFYKDLEKEAEEQYEDNPENLVGPPIDNWLFGGLVRKKLRLLCVSSLCLDVIISIVYLI